MDRSQLLAAGTARKVLKPRRRPVGWGGAGGRERGGNSWRRPVSPPRLFAIRALESQGVIQRGLESL
jgi:hypothetical protein